MVADTSAGGKETRLSVTRQSAPSFPLLRPALSQSTRFFGSLASSRPISSQIQPVSEPTFFAHAQFPTRRTL